jgi:YrbI family 3-deoxy-D-manno-octulosonate 8-phosphate phosphatase
MKDLPFKILFLDVDGVLTDGGMYYSESGDEFKKFNTKDGLAIRFLTKNLGIPVGLVSNGINQKLIQRRANLLGINLVYVGTGKKLEIISDWCKGLHLTLADAAYIGDDVNDLECLMAVGISACPSDAVNKVKNSVMIQLERKGGEACVREFIERYVEI